MKTSFYFVLWITIIWIITLIPMHSVQEYSFILSLLAVYGISVVLRNLIPGILGYDRALYSSDILENIYKGDFTGLLRRLRTDAVLEAVTSVYMLVTVVFIIATMGGNVADSLTGLIVFGLIFFGSAIVTYRLVNGYFAIKDSPDADTAADVVRTVYRLEYTDYYDAHQDRTLGEILPPRPRSYKGWLVASIVIAAVCTLLGTYYLIISIASFCVYGQLSLVTMLSLYGVLAIAFGVKDIINCSKTIKYLKRNNL